MIGKLLIAACLVLPAAAMAAGEKNLTPQQQKTTCNKEASEKKVTGTDREKFMSECLKADSSAAASDKKMTAQQQKMATCNKEAGDKKLAGDERKQFMSSCLKG
jgi:psiF repeat